MVRRFKTRKLKKRGGGIFDFGAGDAAPAPANTDAADAAPASVSWFTGIQKKLGLPKRITNDKLFSKWVEKQRKKNEKKFSTYYLYTNL